MTSNGKRLAVATLIELATRTKNKIQIQGTNRGMQKLTPACYAEATVEVKDELQLRGMLNV